MAADSGSSPRDDKAALLSTAEPVPRFLAGGDSKQALGRRNNTFKLIPRVTQGSWIVKQAVGTTPCLLGNKIDTQYYQCAPWPHPCRLPCIIYSVSVPNVAINLYPEPSPCSEGDHMLTFWLHYAATNTGPSICRGLERCAGGATAALCPLLYFDLYCFEAPLASTVTAPPHVSSM